MCVCLFELLRAVLVRLRATGHHCGALCGSGLRSLLWALQCVHVRTRVVTCLGVDVVGRSCVLCPWKGRLRMRASVCFCVPVRTFWAHVVRACVHVCALLCAFGVLAEKFRCTFGVLTHRCVYFAHR